MTEHEQLIEEIRGRLSNLKEAGSIDPMAVANELTAGYSITVEEICALLIKEVDAAGISHLWYPSPSGRFRGQAACGRLRSESFAMHDENDPEIEYSPLCEEVTRDGLTVRVQIYRHKTGNEGWSLEVVDHEDASTVWDDLFETDHEALAEFSRTL
jgi:hypothetical protein